MVGEASILRRIAQAHRFLQGIMSQDPERIIDDEFEFHIHKSDWKISKENGSRALDLAHQIIEDGYFTIAIELSFYSIERAFETCVMKKKTLKGFRAKHGDVYDLAAKHKLVTVKCAMNLGALWNNYRASQYYSPYVPTKRSAETMIELAKVVNLFIDERL